MHANKGQLNKPENKIADHAICRDALILRDVILQCQKTWPDGTNHDLDRISPIKLLYRKPKDSQDDSRDNSHVRSPETPARASNNGERNMIYGPDGTIPGNHKRYYKEGYRNHHERVAITHSYREHATRKLPSRYVECVRYPVSCMGEDQRSYSFRETHNEKVKLHTDKTSNTPFASVSWNWVKIEICPSSVSLRECRLGLGDMDAGKLELHCCDGRRAS